MTKKMKKLTAMLLAGILVTQGSMPVMALDSIDADDTVTLASKAALFDVLNYVESQKRIFGLDDVDFTELSIGEVPTYEFVSTGFEECKPIYPLFYDGEVIAIAERVVLDETFYQISTGKLVDALNASIDDPVSVIYDAEGIHLYDGESFEKVISDNFSDRLSLALLEDTSSESIARRLNTGMLQEIEYADLGKSTSLNYSSISPRAYNSCSVDTVLQAPFDNLCWAACVACIANYFNNTSYDAEYVARRVYLAENPGTTSVEEDDYNVTREPHEFDDYLRDHYFVPYHCFTEGILTDDIVEENIMDENPLIVGFIIDGGSFDSSGHAMVAFGVDTSAGYAAFMDPAVGTRVVSYRIHTTDNALRYVYTSGEVTRRSDRYVGYSLTDPNF